MSVGMTVHLPFDQGSDDSERHQWEDRGYTGVLGTFSRTVVGSRGTIQHPQLPSARHTLSPGNLHPGHVQAVQASSALPLCPKKQVARQKVQVQQDDGKTCFPTAPQPRGEGGTAGGGRVHGDAARMRAALAAGGPTV